MSKQFEKYLDKCIESYRPSKIKEAMKYSIKGGQRFRPNIIFSIVKGFGLKESLAYPLAAALEFIQTYSLIHDDLPEMDNDDYRRGKPSTHKKYGPGIALLTGDAFLTHSFSLLTSNNSYDAKLKPNLVTALSKYAGLDGMIYGQLLDVTVKKINPLTLFDIQDNKTSGLFKFACVASMYIAGNKNYKYFEKLGSKIGIIFQNQDDLFDVIKSEKEMGKSLSDKDNDKLTALSYLSVDELKKHIDDLFKDLDKYLNKAPFDTKELRKVLEKLKDR